MMNAMNQLSQLFASNQSTALTRPAMTPAPITVDTTSGQARKRNNPFMTALNGDSPEYREMYGVNQPLNKPMFLGYRDNQALYGGSRLFILY